MVNINFKYLNPYVIVTNFYQENTGPFLPTDFYL